VFDIEDKLSTFWLVIITLVSSVSKTGSDNVFIVGSRSFLYIYIYNERQRP
jgi:hypothetical protein